MEKGTVVKFKKPLSKGEERTRMKVLEWYVDSDRCMVEDIDDMPLHGTHVYLKKDLVIA